jgi:hypothetical protein
LKKKEKKRESKKMGNCASSSSLTIPPRSSCPKSLIPPRNLFENQILLSPLHSLPPLPSPYYVESLPQLPRLSATLLSPRHTLSSEENCEQGLLSLVNYKETDGLLTSNHLTDAKKYFNLAIGQGNVIVIFYRALLDVRIGTQIELTPDEFQISIINILSLTSDNNVSCNNVQQQDDDGKKKNLLNELFQKFGQKLDLTEEKRFNVVDNKKQSMEEIEELAISTKNFHILANVYEMIGRDPYPWLIKSAALLNISVMPILYKKTGQEIWLYIGAALNNRVCQGLLAIHFGNRLVKSNLSVDSRDAILASYWYECAIRNGDCPSMENYGRYLLNNVQGRIVDEKRGIYWLTLAAQSSCRSNYFHRIARQIIDKQTKIYFQHVDSLETIIRFACGGRLGECDDMVLGGGSNDDDERKILGGSSAEKILTRGAESLLMHTYKPSLVFDLIHAGLKISAASEILHQRFVSVPNNDYTLKLLSILKIEKEQLYKIAEFLGTNLFNGQQNLVNIVGNYLPWWSNLFSGEEAKQRIKIGKIVNSVMHSR